jgi:Protein of unknown function (DUF3106)
MAITFRVVVLWLCLGSAAALAQTTIENPAWSQLSPDEQRILAPIETEWDELGPQRKLKWLRIAKRFPTMKAEQQARLQDRMREWVTLSEERRRAARERYREIENLSVAERQVLHAKWEEYQREAAEQQKRDAGEQAAPAQEPKDTSSAAPENPEVERPTPGGDTRSQ